MMPADDNCQRRLFGHKAGFSLGSPSGASYA